MKKLMEEKDAKRSKAIYYFHIEERLADLLSSPPGLLLIMQATIETKDLSKSVQLCPL